MADFDKALDFGMANKQETNHRGAVNAEEDSAKLQSTDFFNKLKPKSIEVNDDGSTMPEQEKIGGAFYLKVNDDLVKTWEAVIGALQSMENCDINLEEASDYTAFGLQYYHDSFMLARTRIVKLEGEDAEKSFLEIHKLEGDGFVFADQFKKNLVSKIGDKVEDVNTVDPVASENVKEPSLNYLDLSDENIAMDMIQHWLSTLKPKAGVKYDHRQIYETLSCLGWNINEEANFKALEGWSDHIVGPILEILRHAETTYVPAAYFGAMCIDKFVREDAVPEDVKTWNSVFMLVEAMEKFCLTEIDPKERNVGDFQVTKSREVLRLLISILMKFAPTVTGDKVDALPAKADSVLKALEDEFQDDTVASLRTVLGLSSEEEVQAA